MRILTVGGLGYLGSLISDIMSRSGGDHEVEILDCAMWGNNDVISEVKHDKYHPFQISLKGEFDCIVFSCIPDNPSFYALYPKYVGVLKKLLESCLSSTGKIILCSSYQVCYSATENSQLQEVFLDMENMVSQGNGTIIRVPSLHGPSLRMRWDTIPNQIFLGLYLQNNCLLEAEWLSQVPLAGVLDLAQYIVNDMINDKKSGITVNYFTEKLNILDLAHVIKHAIQEDCPEIDEIIVDTGNSKDVSTLRFFNEPMNYTQSITKSVADFIANLKKNNLPDFLSDKYSNANIISLAEIYRNFLNEVGEQ